GRLGVEHPERLPTGRAGCGDAEGRWNDQSVLVAGRVAHGEVLVDAGVVALPGFFVVSAEEQRLRLCRRIAWPVAGIRAANQHGWPCQEIDVAQSVPG